MSIQTLVAGWRVGNFPGPARRLDLIPLASLLALFGAWLLAASFLSPVLLPSPISVGVSFVALTANGELPKAFIQTLIPFIEGLALAAVVGIVLGWLTGLYRGFGRFVDPYIFIFWATPTVALLPLIFVWFGIGTSAQVVFVFLSAVFPMIINTQAGVKQVERSLVEVLESLGANRQELLRIAIIPSTYPYIFSGLRIAIGRAVVGIIVAQILVAATGIGYMLQYYGEALQLGKYFAPLIATAALAVGLTHLTNWTERRMIRWRTSAF
jgi:NitT/TauT family transport system permease protein